MSHFRSRRAAGSKFPRNDVEVESRRTLHIREVVIEVVRVWISGVRSLGSIFHPQFASGVKRDIDLAIIQLQSTGR